MNATKHGMTARVVMLPTENAAEFKDRMVGFFEEYRPRTPFQAFLAERTVYCSWQLDRAARARSARLCVRAHTEADDKVARVDLEVCELAQVLLRPRFGRPSANPYAEQRDCPTASEIEMGTFGDADPPALLVKRLEGSGAGCRWLSARWNELGAMLKDGMAWRGAERFRVYRLLGIHPADALITAKLTSLLQACTALDPDAGSLISEIWNEMGFRGSTAFVAGNLRAANPAFTRAVGRRGTAAPAGDCQRSARATRREYRAARGPGEARSFSGTTHACV